MAASSDKSTITSKRKRRKNHALSVSELEDSEPAFSQDSMTQEQVRSHVLSLKRRLQSELHSGSEEEPEEDPTSVLEDQQLPSQSKVTPKRNAIPKPSPSTPTDPISYREEMNKLCDFGNTHLNQITTKLLRLDSTSIERMHSLIGESNGIPFRVNVTVRQSELEGDKEEPVIVGLKILLEKEMRIVGTDYVFQRIEKSLLLSDFFAAYESLSKLIRMRTDVYAGLSEKYGTQVKYPVGTSGSVAQIYPQGVQGIIITIDWNVNISKDMACSHDLRMSCKVPKAAAKLDTEELFKNSPIVFDQMVKDFGPDFAIKAILDSCTV